MYYPSLFNDDFVDDLFDEMFGFPYDKPQRKQANVPGHPRRDPAAPRLGTMVTDVRELDDKYILDMEVPGYDKKDIKVELDDGYLKVEAEKKCETVSGNADETAENAADGEANETAEATTENAATSETEDATSKTVAKKPDDKGKYIRRERFYGKMVRSFYVGNDVKKEDITAAFENGILTITIPKVEEKKEIDDKQYIAID